MKKETKTKWNRNRKGNIKQGRIKNTEKSRKNKKKLKKRNSSKWERGTRNNNYKSKNVLIYFSYLQNVPFTVKQYLLYILFYLPSRRRDISIILDIWKKKITLKNNFWSQK